MTDYVRRSARVILLDADDRVLLWYLIWDDARPELGEGWMTPGGGVDPGESIAEAAARELAEETGLVVAPEDLGERVAWREGHAEFGFGTGTYRDDYFLLRVDAHEVDVSGHQDLERSHILGHRWWPVGELPQIAELLTPLGLVGLLEDLISGRAVETPVRLPWHYRR